MIRRPPRSTQSRSSAASDVYKRQEIARLVEAVVARMKKGGRLFYIGAGTSGRLGIVAVSYTHLRAHETVLDLVCRLLLEKKKITQKRYNTHDMLSLQPEYVQIRRLTPSLLL